MGYSQVQVDRLGSLLVGHQIELRRLSTAQAEKALAQLTLLETRLSALLAERMVTTRGISAAAGERGAWTTARLAGLREQVRILLEETYSRLGKTLAADLRALSAYEARFQQALFGQELSVAMALPSIEVLTAIPTTVPFGSGATGDIKLLGKHLSDLAVNQFEAIGSAVSEGYSLGETILQIARRAMDTLETVGKVQAEALVRTSVMNTAGASRTATYRANEDIVQGEEWSSTLDGRTTLVCMSNDGATRKWEDESWSNGYAEGYPAHYNERSQLLPWLRDSPPTTGETYPEWLASQPQERVADILGPKRAELFLSGKLPITRFVDSSGATYTLQELASREGIEL